MQAQLASFIATSKRFVIERELGQGGMGVVFQALDTERGTRVALKALNRRDAVHIYRLKNEFRQLADVSHPNLVTLHELFQEGESWFFTMELVEGRAFDEHCAGRRSGPLVTPGSRLRTLAGRFLRDVSVTLSPPSIGGEMSLAPRTACSLRRVRPALRQLVEGVAALHGAGKLHRDLKPSNVLVTPMGRVVVLDFGLVSSSTHVHVLEPDRTIGGSVFGTPAYMSPEQAADEPLTPASDWYSVGAMLYEVLTGQLPFDGSVLEILRQKEECEPSPPSEIVQGVPDDLDQLCRELLRRDPAKRPSGADILRYLTGQSSPPPVLDAQAASVPTQHDELFVGREQHLAALRDAFEASSAGKSVTVLVHGHSGMGKTALVRCFANELIARDEAVILRGRCYERESVPYKAFDNIADALSRHLLGLSDEEAAALLPRAAYALPLLFPVLRHVKAIAAAVRPKHASTDALELRNQAFGAFKELLGRICDRRPLVINIDDLQWADLDSARLLSWLLAPPDPPPMLLVGTYRRDDVAQSPFLAEILGAGPLADGTAELRKLALDALSPSEAEALAGAWLQRLRADDPCVRQILAAEAEGIPFFIGELVQHQGLRSARGEGTARLSTPSLDQVLLERVRGMPEGAQQLLQVLAVAGGPLEQGIAIDAAGLPRGDRAATLALRAARLIKTRGTRERDSAEPYHDRVRETVLRALDRDSVRALHACIAHTLDRHNIRDPERLVVHYEGAGDLERAADAAIEAAEVAASKLAFNRAAELYVHGLELLRPDDPRRLGVRERLGDAFASAGKGAQAAEAYLAAMDGQRGEPGRRLQTLAAQQYLRSGRIDEGTALAETLYREVGLTFPSSPAKALLSLGMNGARLALGSETPTSGEPAAALERERLRVLGATFRELALQNLLQGAALQTQFLRQAIRAGDVEQTMHGLAWKAWRSAIVSGDRKSAFDTLARVDELAARAGTPYALATAASARAGCHLFMRELTDVAEHAQAAEKALEHCQGTHWERTVARAYRFTASEHVGGYAALLREIPQRAAAARERSDYVDTLFSGLFFAWAQLVSDRPVEAMHALDELGAVLPRAYGSFHVLCAFRKAHVLLYQERPLAALEHMEAEYARFRASPAKRALFYRVTMHSIMGRVYVAAADADGARRKQHLRAALVHGRALAEADQPHTRGLSQCLLAEVALRRGNDARACELLTWCVDRTDRHRAPMLATYASRALGSLLGGDRGARRIADADAALSAEGVVAPAQWARIWVNV